MIFSILAESDILPAIGGTVGIIVFLFLLALSIAWLLLPFLILASLGKIRESIATTNRLLESQSQIQQSIRIALDIESQRHEAIHRSVASETSSLLDRHLQTALEQRAVLDAAALQNEVAIAQGKAILDAHARTNELLTWGANLAAKKAAPPAA